MIRVTVPIGDSEASAEQAAIEFALRLPQFYRNMYRSATTQEETVIVWEISHNTQKRSLPVS